MDGFTAPPPTTAPTIPPDGARVPTPPEEAAGFEERPGTKIASGCFESGPAEDRHSADKGGRDLDGSDLDPEDDRPLGRGDHEERPPAHHSVADGNAEASRRDRCVAEPTCTTSDKV